MLWEDGEMAIRLQSLGGKHQENLHPVRRRLGMSEVIVSLSDAIDDASGIVIILRKLPYRTGRGAEEK